MFDVQRKSHKKRQEWKSQASTGKITKGHVGREMERAKTRLHTETNPSTESLRIAKFFKKSIWIFVLKCI